jgi:7-carboxy-7-deazaguanine synthase
MLQVSEIFRSLQGEGLYAGKPMSFLRLKGCNINCRWCDTTYASRADSKFEELSVTEVVSKLKALPTRKGDWICITGGEPLLQSSNLEKFIGLSNVEGWKITIETNGTYLPPSWKQRIDSWNADIKCPSSGMSGKSLEDWLFLTSKDQVKFVVEDRYDIQFVENTLVRCKNRTSQVLISPCIQFDLNDRINRKSYEWLPVVASFCVERHLTFSLQIHKFIWGNKKGV